MNFDKIKNNNFIVLDTETTGLRYGADRLCSFYGRKLVASSYREVSSFGFLCDPEVAIPEKVTSINGFCRDDSDSLLNLKGLPKFASYANMMMDFLSGSVPVCHNASFDIIFIMIELAPFISIKNFSNAVPHVICTKNTYASILGKEKSFDYIPDTSLDSLCQYLKVENENRQERHTAVEDTKVTASCFVKLTKEYPENIFVFETGKILEYMINTIIKSPKR